MSIQKRIVIASPTFQGFKTWKVCIVLLLLATTACTYTIKIKDGATAYERKQYALAIPFLQKEVTKAKTRKEKGIIAFRLADAFQRTGQPDKALSWFQMAYDNSYGPEALKGLAYTLKKLERYKEAQEAFKNLGIEIGTPYEYRKEITGCTVAADWQKKAPETGYTITPTPFNSPQNDFSPVWYADRRLVFTSDRAMSGGEDRYRWTNNKFMDFFIVGADEASAQLMGGGLNTPANEGTLCFNAAVNEVFFVRAVGAYKGDDAFCKIYYAKRFGDDWQNPEPLPFQKEKINYLHPVLSGDGNTLYFACNDPDGWGGYDIYSAQRNARKETGWDDPKLLGRNINTTANELFPTFDADTLYFASDGLAGMGGLDVFRTYKMDKNNWAPPLNLKAPINSGSDDFGLLVDPTTVNRSTSKKIGDLLRAGFVSSNRPGGRGGDDIYRFEYRLVPPPPPPPVKIDTQKTPKPLVYKLLLEGYVLEKIRANADDPNSAVLGRRPLPGSKVQIDIQGKKQTVTVGEDGMFKLELTENTDYAFFGSKENYLNNSTKFSTKGIAKDPTRPVQTFEVEIELDKIYRNREIVLENIYYDYDKWDIRPDAEPTLNRLVEVLRQNPNIRIQLGSHTDCRGNDSYNQSLSQKRAESAVAYMTGKGIAAERLAAVGYGESQPSATCACARCSEAEHQTNRRTTFKIVE
jgi:peptidoglycan-associated lipoprotein